MLVPMPPSRLRARRQSPRSRMFRVQLTDTTYALQPLEPSLCTIDHGKLDWRLARIQIQAKLSDIKGLRALQIWNSDNLATGISTS